jgi:hypothetical protein
MIGIFRARASTSSGLSRWTAEEIDLDPPPQPGQAAGDLAGLQVGAGDGVAEVEQHLGDAAHADAADADEVDAGVA